MKRIAYLAPEIPALSATFVYNEILALQAMGYQIIPLSVHFPQHIAEDERVAALRKSTCYLYKKGLGRFLLSTCLQLLTAPNRTMVCFRTLLQDVRQVGLFSRTGLGLFYRFAAACQVARVLKREGCTHLHIHFAHVPTDIGMYASLLTGIPFSFTAHANDIFERGWLLREKIARSKFTATISNYNRNWLITKGCQGDKIQIVRCGIDSSRFTPAPLKKIVPPFRVGSIGRMVEKKGFDTLIEAAALLKKKGVNLRLVVAGDGPMRTTLYELVDKLQLQDTVELPGSIANQDVPAWLHTLDLFVLPCREDQNGDMDGIPVVLMEAMLSGIPVVSTRISGIPELITDEVSGLLTAPHEPHSLARAMERLLLYCELRETTCQNAIEQVRLEFDAQVNIKRLLRLISA